MFLKHAIALVILGVAALGLCAQANTVHDTLIAEKPAKGLVPQEWLQRLEKVEGYQQITDTLLANRFDGLANEQKFSFWITLVTLISIGAGAYFSIRGGMTAEVARIETKIRQQMDQEATRTLEKVTADAQIQIAERINRNLDKTLTDLLGEKTKSLLAVAELHAHREKVKENAKILVLVEQEDKIAKIREPYEAIGLKNLTFLQMPADWRKHENWSGYDLIVFDRNEGVVPSADYSLMQDQVIVRMVQDFGVPNQLFFFLGKRVVGFDSIPTQVNFANTPSTLERNIVDHLLKRFPYQTL